MKRTPAGRALWAAAGALCLGLLGLACAGGGTPAPTPEPPPITVVMPATLPPPPTLPAPLLPTSTPPFLDAPADSGTMEHLWAVRSFAEPETAADPDMADGEPDAEDCGDTLRAWAPPPSGEPAVLTLTYAAPLLPEQVSVVQSGNPGGILRVEVQNAVSGLGRVIYEAEPKPEAACPQTLSIPVEIDFAVDKVILTLAASETPTQIDAVELSGSLPYFVDAPLFWRIALPSQDAPEEFGLPGGMAADERGLFFLAEGAHGLYTVDVEGNILAQQAFEPEVRLGDVALDAAGNRVLVDTAARQYRIVTEQGEQLGAGGRDFAFERPRAAAVHPRDGELYLLDEKRIQVYSALDGKHLRDLPLDSSLMNGLAFDAGGNLYTAGNYDGGILKIDPYSGEVLDTLGVPELANTTARDLALDVQGNLYVLVNSSPGSTAVYMLDSGGSLLKRFGRLVDDPAEWTEGTLFDPISLAVSPDGRFLVICDASQDVTYLTTLMILE